MMVGVCGIEMRDLSPLRLLHSSYRPCPSLASMTESGVLFAESEIERRSINNWCYCYFFNGDM